MRNWIIVALVAVIATGGTVACIQVQENGDVRPSFDFENVRCRIHQSGTPLISFRFTPRDTEDYATVRIEAEYIIDNEEWFANRTFSGLVPGIPQSAEIFFDSAPKNPGRATCRITHWVASPDR